MTTPFVLDSRQRAMLLEMGVRVWLPSATVDVRAAPLAPAHASLAHASPQKLAHATEQAEQAGASRLKASATSTPLSTPVRREPPLRLPVLSRPPESALGAPVRYVIGNLPAHAQAFDYILLGEPCTGDAEKLLTNIIKALGGNCFIAHMVVAEDDDTPLLQQLGQLSAQAMVLLGPHSAKALLGEASHSTPFGKLRGQVHRIDGLAAKLVVTYHPLQLLRQPLAKAQAWLDLRQVFLPAV